MSDEKEFEDITPVESGQQTTPDDLDELLRQYNKPMDLAPESDSGISDSETERIVSMSQEGSGLGSTAIEEKLGNPKYYQRGKKAGQLRPGYEVKGKMTITGDLLDSAMFITLIDTVIPMLICLTNNSFSPIKIDPDKMMLTEKQKKQLEPICAQVVKKLSLTTDPVALLLVALTSMYGIQFWSLRVDAKQEYDAKRKAENETIN